MPKSVKGKKKGKKSDRKSDKRSGTSRFRKPRPYILRKKKCRFCTDKGLKINYLDQPLLRRFTTERGKIIPSRISGTCAKHQRKLAKAIKRARSIGIMPFLAE